MFRWFAFIAVLVAAFAISESASAQCASGRCERSVLLRPIRVATAPVRVIRERQVIRRVVSVRPVRAIFGRRCR